MSTVVVPVSRDLSVAPPPEAIDASPFSFDYTGKHDDGDLPPICVAAGTASAFYGHLVDSLREAKTAVDALVKAEVMRDASSGSSAGAAAAASAKVNISRGSILPLANSLWIRWAAFERRRGGSCAAEMYRAATPSCVVGLVQKARAADDENEEEEEDGDA